MEFTDPHSFVYFYVMKKNGKTSKGISKKWKATFCLGLTYMLAMITFSCVEMPDLNDLCPDPIEADALSLKEVFYSPYSNQQYSSSTDTVPLGEFRFNFELEIQQKENPSGASLPGQAFALSCAQTFNIRNISNISVILTAPFAGLPIGTDIGYLLETPEGEKLSELRTFEGISVYFGTRLNITPENYSQLKTRTFLFLRNGDRSFIDSTSPYIKIN
ncbi:hypothetical protein Aoki45_02880 [Algoriphagus sp. oki45]|uniref:hypothetical protein n=1 Tax=Algoriphagus sp. oki45 TaxID=3067294 RepID=UPI0027F22884|nr:hypothetical protein Aoki45_02880 [Algoriphagus sp. oki45]